MDTQPIQTTPPATPSPLDLNAAKTRAEIAKLEAEARTLNRPFHRTPTFWTAALPVVATLAGIFLSISSGWFSTQRDKLDAVNERLEARKFALTAENERIVAQGVTLKREESVQREVLKGLEEQMNALKAQVASAREDQRRAEESLTRAKQPFASLRTNVPFLHGAIVGFLEDVDKFAEKTEGSAKARFLIEEKVRSVKDSLLQLQMELQIPSSTTGGTSTGAGK